MFLLYGWVDKAECGKEAGILEYLGVCICNNNAFLPEILLDSEDGACVLKATSLSSTINQSVSQFCKRERERREDAQWTKTLGQENKEVAKALFSSQKVLQNFSDFSSHRIFRRMHGVLNINENKN